MPEMNFAAEIAAVTRSLTVGTFERRTYLASFDIFWVLVADRAT